MLHKSLTGNAARTEIFLLRTKPRILLVRVSLVYELGSLAIEMRAAAAACGTGMSKLIMTVETARGRKKENKLRAAA